MNFLKVNQMQPETPTIICLCGSTRFMEEFQKQNHIFTMAGYIVLTVGCFPHGEHATSITSEQKIKLDELHKRKIDLCDIVFVINKDQYIGESTRSEIEYAAMIGRRTIYLEPTRCKYCLVPEGSEHSRLCVTMKEMNK